MPIQLSNTIRPAFEGAIAYASDIRGANQSVATLIERNAILEDLRVAGMVCYVVETQKYYSLSNDLINWVEWTGGSVQPTKFIKSFDYTQDAVVLGTTGVVIVSEINIHIVEPFNPAALINVTAGGVLIFSNDSINPNRIGNHLDKPYTEASGEFLLNIQFATQGQGRIFIILE